MRHDLRSHVLPVINSSGSCMLTKKQIADIHMGGKNCKETDDEGGKKYRHGSC